MGVFTLDYRDTKPVLVVTLLEPDGITVHNLTGATAARLLVKLSDGTRLIREMAIDGTRTTGKVSYQWVTTDWDIASGTLVDGAYPVGGLVVGPGTDGPSGFVLRPTDVEHRMKYEVVGPAGARLTFPNGPGDASPGYDVLRITDDFGQGA